MLLLQMMHNLVYSSQFGYAGMLVHKHRKNLGSKNLDKLPNQCTDLNLEALQSRRVSADETG